MRSDYLKMSSFEHILAALMPENRLAILVSLTTGLRIDDVLHIKSADLLKDRFTVKEMKTGKTRRVRLDKKLRDEILRYSGKIYAFENRLDYKRPRTRQAVYKDIKRACECFRVKNLNVTPHSARKIYSVEEYKRTCSVEHVQRLLNHSSEAVTLLYALADQVTEQDKKRNR